MTPNEFKAWFDGFTEAFDKAPTQRQWARIKARVAEIDGKAVTERVYVDRYLPTYPPYIRWSQPYNGGPIWMNGINTATCSSAGSSVSFFCYSVNADNSPTFDSLSAMNALGIADAQALAS